MRIAVLSFALACAATLPAPARANDSSAELATGGLVFVKNDDVEMTSEDLYVSAAEIRVRYRFVNKADRDVTVHVAFPMPEIKIDGPDQNISVPTEDPVNLLGFVTTVNGAAVRTEVEQRVTVNGTDHTALLKSLGVPLAPHLRSTSDVLDKVPRDKWDELIRLRLAEIEEYDVGQGMEKHLSPRWSLKTTFYWQQTFPARAETAIEHRYQPSVGASVQTSLAAPSLAKEPWVADYTRKYCIERDLVATLERARKAAKAEFGPPYSEQRIDYILSTGANWAGPIRDFRLTIDKGDTDSLVSFCGNGVTKTGPTTFEMRKTDFTPQGDFAVLILKKLKPEP
ncbi:MAG: DUF4424 domain-containing protein [Rhodoplanes sp.]|uniref:DUF4424 domain-containing protein n=1 Tax=Rhodoplanes sp. TaxID=1968906 RepID=UPI0017B837AD|nr:DUF4424 domain-containing protein [Rhodoplanes sp.]NVO17630.1 DUF4424 domain-containing protein [Rhodoplanes sp.]